MKPLFLILACSIMLMGCSPYDVPSDITLHSCLGSEEGPIFGLDRIKSTRIYTPQGALLLEGANWSCENGELTFKVK